MARFWKNLTGKTEPDPFAVAKLEESRQQLTDVHNRSIEIYDLTSYLSKRREQNHFGDSLTISFTPRRRHA